MARAGEPRPYIGMDVPPYWCVFNVGWNGPDPQTLPKTTITVGAGSSRPYGFHHPIPPGSSRPFCIHHPIPPGVIPPFLYSPPNFARGNPARYCAKMIMARAGEPRPYIGMDVPPYWCVFNVGWNGPDPKTLPKTTITVGAGSSRPYGFHHPIPPLRFPPPNPDRDHPARYCAKTIMARAGEPRPHRRPNEINQ